jgi:hypothetical protein
MVPDPENNVLAAESAIRPELPEGADDRVDLDYLAAKDCALRKPDRLVFDDRGSRSSGIPNLNGSDPPAGDIHSNYIFCHFFFPPIELLAQTPNPKTDR